MKLNRDFQEFIESFVTHNVRFLIVGGYALAAHGHPRYTKDLDRPNLCLNTYNDWAWTNVGLTML